MELLLQAASEGDGASLLHLGIHVLIIILSLSVDYGERLQQTSKGRAKGMSLPS